MSIPQVVFLQPDVVEVEPMPYFNTRTPHGRDQQRAWLRKQRKALLERDKKDAETP